MSLSGTRIGWIGAGKMGGPMSRRVADAGADVTVYDPVAENAQAAGGRAVGSGIEAVADAEIVVSMIPNDAILRDVALGDGGILSAMQPGTIYVDMSTVAPETSLEVAAAAEAAQVGYLRAPVSGSTILAEAGNLTIMVSGPREAADRCDALFDTLGAKHFYVGDSEQGRYLKLVLNLLVGTSGAVLGEALTLGRKGGLDWEQMLDVIGESVAASPYYKYNLDPLKARDFTPMFSAEQMLKDSRLISDAGAKAGVPMAFGDAMLRLFEETVAAGHGEDNLTVAMKILEKKSDLEDF